jgi:hypothetical protein
MHVAVAAVSIFMRPRRLGTDKFGGAGAAIMRAECSVLCAGV